jgi:AraC-like DNA-binding protein
MLKTILQPKSPLPAVVTRLAGDIVPELQHHIPVSRWLEVAVYEMTEASDLPEEGGRLISLPVDDAVFSIQLAYLVHRSSSSSAIVLISFHPDFLSQWSAALLQQEQAFRFDHSSEHQIRIEASSRTLIDALLSSAAITPDLGSSLLYMEHGIQLLRRAIEQMSVPFAPCVVPACRFLAYESEREKIHKARAILDAHYDERLTIKDLARKVAMNECYLKKGFKTLTGSTIHDYVASRRIASARHMLQSEGRSVTEVAASLGYSSISHFSTAFKKATGLKPCELLS